MSDCAKVGREIKLRASVEKYEVVGEITEDSGTASKALSFLAARVSLVPSGQYVIFIVRVTAENKTWTLRKRFSEIAGLHETIAARLHSVPNMPAKSVTRQFDAPYLESRKATIDSYFQQLVRRRDILNCSEVQQFFQLPENLPGFRHPHASEPVQAAEVQEAAFGITNASYDPTQGMLLIGATDCSWTSRMDTRITNIKLPWEPSAPNLPTSQMSLWRQSPADLRFDMLFTCRYAAAISEVVLSARDEKGYCLCALGDGTVGCQSIKGEPGVNNMGTTLPLLRHTADVVGLAFDSESEWVMTASQDKGMIVYDIRKQLVLCEMQTPQPCSVMHYCQEQKKLFTGLQNGKIIVWDTSKLPVQQVASLPDAPDPLLSSRICALDYDATSSTLFAGAKEGFSLWSIKSSNKSAWGRCVGSIKDLMVSPTAIAWANSSREILAGFSNGAVIVFDVDCGEATYAIQAHRDEVTWIMWLDAPRRLLTASKDKTMKIWDFPSLRRTTQGIEDLLDNVTIPVSGTSVAESSGSKPSGGRGRGGGAGSAQSFDPADPLGLGRRSAGASGSAEGYSEERPFGAASSLLSTGGDRSLSSTADPLGRPKAPSDLVDSGGTSSASKVRVANPFGDPPAAPIGSAAAAAAAPAALSANPLAKTSDNTSGNSSRPGRAGSGGGSFSGSSDPLGNLHGPSPLGIPGSSRPKAKATPKSSMQRNNSDEDLFAWDK